SLTSTAASTAGASSTGCRGGGGVYAGGGGGLATATCAGIAGLPSFLSGIILRRFTEVREGSAGGGATGASLAGSAFFISTFCSPPKFFEDNESRMELLADGLSACWSRIL